MLSNDTAEGLLNAARAALEALETIERRKGQQLWLDIGYGRDAVVIKRLREAVESVEREVAPGPLGTRPISASKPAHGQPAPSCRP
jgi:hypothetical protein